MTRKTRGFTLIELLVVISIISLLTTVVLANVNTARANTRNAQRNSVASQYKVALELAYNATNAYPDTGGNWVCLGITGQCWSGSYSNSSTVDSALSEFVAGKQTPITTGLTYDGMLYIQNSPSDYDLLWFLEGVNKSCGPGRIYDPNYDGIKQTYCILER